MGATLWVDSAAVEVEVAAATFIAAAEDDGVVAAEEEEEGEVEEARSAEEEDEEATSCLRIRGSEGEAAMGEGRERRATAERSRNEGGSRDKERSMAGRDTERKEREERKVAGRWGELPWKT